VGGALGCCFLGESHTISPEDREEGGVNKVQYYVLRDESGKDQDGGGAKSKKRFEEESRKVIGRKKC